MASSGSGPRIVRFGVGSVGREDAEGYSSNSSSRARAAAAAAEASQGDIVSSYVDIPAVLGGFSSPAHRARHSQTAYAATAELPARQTSAPASAEPQPAQTTATPDIRHFREFMHRIKSSIGEPPADEPLVGIPSDLHSARERLRSHLRRVIGAEEEKVTQRIEAYAADQTAKFRLRREELKREADSVSSTLEQYETESERLAAVDAWAAQHFDLEPQQNAGSTLTSVAAAVNDQQGRQTRVSSRSSTARPLDGNLNVGLVDEEDDDPQPANERDLVAQRIEYDEADESAASAAEGDAETEAAPAEDAAAVNAETTDDAAAPLELAGTTPSGSQPATAGAAIPASRPRAQYDSLARSAPMAIPKLLQRHDDSGPDADLPDEATAEDIVKSIRMLHMSYKQEIDDDFSPPRS